MLPEPVERFLDGGPFAVVGASRDRAKYGNKVLRAYHQDGREAFPVNPTADEIAGHRAYPDLGSLPGTVHGISVITPPPVTERVVDEAIDAGIKHIWMQPGAESPDAVQRARDAGINVIAGDHCALVVMGYREN